MILSDTDGPEAEEADDEVPKRVKRSFSAAIPRSGFAGAELAFAFASPHGIYRQPASSASSAERADLISRAIIPISSNAESKTAKPLLCMPATCQIIASRPLPSFLFIYRRTFMERDIYAFGHHNANPCSVISSGQYLLI